MCSACVTFFRWRSECRHRLEMLICRPFTSQFPSSYSIPASAALLECTYYACAPNTPLPAIDRRGRSVSIPSLSSRGSSRENFFFLFLVFVFVFWMNWFYLKLYMYNNKYILLFISRFCSARAVTIFLPRNTKNKNDYRRVIEIDIYANNSNNK